jgi:sporulation integral membrane protein YlbJ
MVPILRKHHVLTLFLGGAALLLVSSLIMFPEEAFHASLKGLKIWWEVVFPASLPFFITSELLMGFGLVHFIGVLLEPVMRPIFRVPGTGAFVMAMGLSSGFPIGAKLTARLREQRIISRIEGERLVSFTNNSNPLFLSGAVAVGFFHDVSLAIILMVCHYASSIIVGCMMRFHGRRIEMTREHVKRGNLWFRAFRAMHIARVHDGRPFGRLMGDAVTSSMQTLLLIGGFIIMYSVMIHIFSIIGVTQVLVFIVGLVLIPLGVPESLITAFVSGVFEITIGAQLAGSIENVNLMWKMVVASAFLAWSGLSVHSQVASILSTTDLRYRPFMFAKMIQGIVAALITLILWHPLREWSTEAAQAFGQASQPTGSMSFLQQWTSLPWHEISLGLTLTAFLIWLLSKRATKRQGD